MSDSQTSAGPSDAVRRVITRTSVIGFGLGVVLSPIPLADELLLLPVYAVMTTRIAKHHGLPFKKIAWRPILSTVAAGLAARAAINVTVSFIPGVAAVANAVSAAALTQLMGRYVDAACADPSAARAMTPSAIIAVLRQRIAPKPA
jgi:uncharacterized protein (DUF697 family)